MEAWHVCGQRGGRGRLSTPLPGSSTDPRSEVTGFVFEAPLLPLPFIYLFIGPFMGQPRVMVKSQAAFLNPMLLLISCMTSDKLISVPRFPHL